MSNSIHLTNAKGRDATVGLAPVKGPPAPKLGLPDEVLEFRRYLAAAEDGTHAVLQAKLGEDYASALVEADPEADLELVGSTVENTQNVFLDGDGKLMFSDPRMLELILNPDGSEKERRDPVDTAQNVNVEQPVRWTGKKIAIKDAVRRFAFRRRLQLRHTDGLTFDYLFEIARELEASQSIKLRGTGEKGSAPLVFQANGRSYRGFLEGKTKGKSYQLILHLSDMELKPPARKKSSLEEK
jgi:hypothetical protein